MTLTEVRDVLAIAATCSGMLSAICGLVYRLAVRPRMQRHEQRLQRIEKSSEAAAFHLRANGYEHRLPQAQREQPVRELVIDTANEVRAMGQRLAEQAEWQREHEITHARQFAAEGGS